MEAWHSWRDRPLYTQHGHLVTERSIQPEQYGRFLVGVYEEWVRHDVGRIYVQMFDVALASWVGMHSLCVFAPTCGNALALEHNGDLYSCDHFVEPAYLLGNIRDEHMIELVASPKQRKFGQDKQDTLPQYCLTCDVKFACNGGCPKDRFITTPTGEPGLNYLCAGYKIFFHHIDRDMRFMANQLRQDRAPADIMAHYAEADRKLQAAFAGAKRNDPCPCGSGKKFKVLSRPLRDCLKRRNHGDTKAQRYTKRLNCLAFLCAPLCLRVFVVAFQAVAKRSGKEWRRFMAGHLIVLTFQGSERAAAALEAVQRLAAHGWIELDDAVIALRSAADSHILVMPLTALALTPEWQPGAPLALAQVDSPQRKRFRAPADVVAALAGWLLSDPTRQQVLQEPLAAITPALQALSEAETALQSGQVKADVSALFLFGSAEHSELVLESLRELDSQVTLTRLTTEQEQALRGWG